MSNIRIERLPIQQYNLWIIRADHLQLVLQQDELDGSGQYQERWFVLEGLRDSLSGPPVVGVLGADALINLSQANGGLTGDDLLQAIGSPWYRGSRVIDSFNAVGDWDLMRIVGRDIDAQRFPYFAFSPDFSPLPEANSSSVIASLLYYVGVDIANNLPVMPFTFSTGTQTLLGTSQGDEMVIEWSFNTLMGGVGDDELRGSNAAQSEKLFGGEGDDVFYSSEGSHIYHGGQPGLDYADDGMDLVDYRGIGQVVIEAGFYPTPHFLPNLTASHATGVDSLFSIERIRWDLDNDVVTFGEGVLTEDFRIEFDLKNENPGTRGDELDLTLQDKGILSAPSDRPDIVLIGYDGGDGGFSDGGLWTHSLEWLVGSAGDDRIYAGASMLGAEGGAGNDVLSGRNAGILTGLSPRGYDIELTGGAGDDTLISGTGRSLATGGEGADRFVLSALSEAGRVVEFVIEGADTTDRLFVPFNFLTPGGGGFDGSELFPVLGAISPVIGGAAFEFLPQNAGPGVQGGYDEPGYFFLTGLVPTDGTWTGSWEGALHITDQIAFNRDGNDLLIHVWGNGEVYAQSFITLGDDNFVYQEVFPDFSTEAVIRVVGFEEGMLGINFYELGEETPFPFPGGSGEPDPAKILTTAGFLDDGGTVLAEALAPGPETAIFDRPLEDEAETREEINGTSGDDEIIASAIGQEEGAFQTGSDLSGGAGNDVLTGSDGRDTLDGGAGADTMSGGRGDDRYVVDSAGDAIIEGSNSGIDGVAASLDYVLPQNIEHLTLTGGATLGQGNDGNNRIVGTDGANILRGMGGADRLDGGRGDDLIDGGSGDDAYFYTFGDGIDTIVNGGETAGNDWLRFFGLAPDDVQIFQASDGESVILRLADGGRVVLSGFLGGGSISSVGFDDQTVWDAGYLSTQAAASGVLVNDAPIAGDDLGFYTHLTDFVLPGEALLANDWDVEGSALAVVSAGNATGGAVTLTADGGIRVVATPGQTGVVTFDYTVADAQGAVTTARAAITITANAAPVAAGDLPDYAVQAGAAWTATVPPETFSDPDGHLLIYSATLDDGGDLPPWLTFDPETLVISGTAPPDAAGDLVIRIVASDGLESVSVDFLLSIEGGEPGLTLIGTRRSDVLTGGAGDDVIIGDLGNDFLTGNAGDDLFLSSGSAGFDTYDGGIGYDEIRGSDGDDVIGIRGKEITDRAGVMSIVLLLGIEKIDGGDGFDTLRLEGTANVLDLTSVSVSGIELISGGGGADVIFGSAGDDVIDGGVGNDSLSGGLGNDVFLSLGNAGFDAVDGGEGYDEIRGGAGDDVIGLRATAVADELDQITLVMLPGVEAIDGGDGFDVLRLGGTADVLDLTNVSVTGIEEIRAGGGNDVVYGSAGNDVIAGGTGNDQLFGGLGDDTFLIAGNVQKDQFDGGAGYDRIVGSAGDDILFLENGNADLTSIEAIDLGEGFDVLRLGGGADTINLSNIDVQGLDRIDGGSGNDRITGSSADDNLFGGTGQDVFVFADIFGHDRIEDFALTFGRQNGDQIDLSAFPVGSFEDLMIAAIQVGDDTVINLVEWQSSVTIANVAISSLQADDFIL